MEIIYLVLRFTDGEFETVDVAFTSENSARKWIKTQDDPECFSIQEVELFTD